MPVHLMTLIDMSRLPAAVRASAMPRWSHRDPVEGGDPFSSGDPRRPLWETATHAAAESLTRVDANLAREDSGSPDADDYRERVIDLATARFDIWARRVATVVRCERERMDAEQWLEQYVDNWLAYVSETCPHIDARDDLHIRLTARADHWIGRIMNAAI